MNNSRPWKEAQEVPMRFHKLPAIILVVSILAMPNAAQAKEAQASVIMPEITAHLQQERLALAQANPTEFLQVSLKNYQNYVQDYTCLFVKQEFVKGKLSKEQQIEVKFREEPFSVFMKWVQNPGLVDHVLYVKGRNDDKALIKPAGWLGYLVPTHVTRPVNDPDSAKVSRRRLDQFGFANALQLILGVNATATEAGELKFDFKRESNLNGRKTFVFERILPDKAQYPDNRLVLYVDQEWLLPVGTYAYDTKGKLLGKYEYRDVKLNVGLSRNDFTAQANDL
jgi:hypothetical protein